MKQEWEAVADDLQTTTGRLKVEGGWLYRVIRKNYEFVAMTFVPSTHELDKAWKNLP